MDLQDGDVLRLLGEKGYHLKRKNGEEAWGDMADGEQINVHAGATIDFSAMPPTRFIANPVIMAGYSVATDAKVTTY